jgi:hypothetical protein
MGAALLVLLLAAAPTQEPPRPSPTPPSSCLQCHLELGGQAAEPVAGMRDDVHAGKGLSCHDCHGGNAAAGHDGDIDAAHDAAKGWREAPTRLQVPQFCARCHADAEYMKRFNPHTRIDQLGEYRTSVHGRKNAAGDARTAVCIDCHGVHGIRAVADARSSVHPTHLADTCARCHADAGLMDQYGMPTAQYADYKTSVHAQALYGKGDLAAPTCNDCHGSHGAVPPGVGSVANVCGSCHGREASLFRETEQKKGLELDLCIQCMVCHDNHAVKAPTPDMLGVGPRSTCISCHGEGEPEYAAASRMGAGLERLRAGLADARGRLERAEQAGVEVSEDQFALQKAQDHVVEARVLVHSFDEERFQAAVAEGAAVVETGHTAGRRAFRELRERRIGLGISLIVIVAVIAGLVLKVRQIEAE